MLGDKPCFLLHMGGTQVLPHPKNWLHCRQGTFLYQFHKKGGNLKKFSKWVKLESALTPQFLLFCQQVPFRSHTLSPQSRFDPKLQFCPGLFKGKFQIQSTVGKLVEKFGYHPQEPEIEFVLVENVSDKLRGFSGMEQIFINANHFDKKQQEYMDEIKNEILFEQVVRMDMVSLILHEYGHVKLWKVKTIFFCIFETQR